MAKFQPGSRVIWWKRITQAVEYPYNAEVVKVGLKRITISVEDLHDAHTRFIRHVSVNRLQPVGCYHAKAVGQGPAVLEPMASWGRFTRFLEVGEDLRAVRQVDVFENENMLCYDRVHWVDDYGMLGHARINRNRNYGPWGQSEEIAEAEFEEVWRSARVSAMFARQVESARMSQMGALPVWLTIQGWRPD